MRSSDGRKDADSGEAASSTVQSVERAIAVLKCFSRDKPDRGVNEISRELGLHKSIVSRLVVTLERAGLLWRHADSGRYRLGIELVRLAGEVVSFLDVREVAQPVLRQLSEDCQETVNLAVLDGDQVIDIDQYVVHTRRTATIGWIGRRMPVHATAAGKVFLAYLPPEQVRRMAEAGLQRLTPATVVAPDELERQLAIVRDRGFATAEGELEEGLNAIGAPVFDRNGRVECAASVGGPAYRMTAERMSEMSQLLVAATREISRHMGYAQPDGQE